MGRLRTSAMECNYREVEKHLKELFIHRLNGSEMPTEIIYELTKCDENAMIPCECVFIWAKRIETQRAQIAVINSLLEVKNFDATLQKDESKWRETKLVAPIRMPA